MKQIFLKEKGKKELFTVDHFPISIPREYEEQIFMLKNLIATDDRNSSHSENSSPEETDREEVKGQTVK